MLTENLTNPQMLLPLLVMLCVATLGGAFVLAHAMRRTRIEQRISGTATAEQTTSSRWADRLARLGENLHNERDAPGLRQRLAQAGYHNPAAPLIYLGSQGVTTMLGLMAGLALVFAIDGPTPLRLSIVVAIAAGAALLPSAFVGAARKRRTRSVRQSLPDAVDLLEVSVSAGMGLDAAWNAVAQQVREVNPTLGDEMALTNLEMQLGASRSQAFRNMAERTGAEELNSLVAVLHQSERFGTSISQALRSFAESMRRGRSQRAETAAERLSVKLLLPMLVFIFPVLLIVILGPALMRIADTFSNLNTG